MNWPFRPAHEMCEIAVDCVNKTAPTVNYETEFKMIRTTNVKNGFIDLNDVRYVTEEVFKKWTRRSKPKYGDVILTREAPVGEVGRFTSLDDKVFLGQRLFHYRPDPKKLDWNFLAYALQSPTVQGRFKGMGFGATVDHVRVGDAEKLPIPCPPLKVQKKIGNTLSAYDDLIENNRRRIQLLEQAAQMLYKEWFVHLRFPGHEHVKIEDGVPEGWEKQYLPEVIQVNPKTTVEKGKEILYAPMSALSETNMTLDTSVFERRTKHTNVKFRKNDVLLARITPCLENGKTGFVHFLANGEVGCGSTELIVLRGKKVSPAFTYCLARSYNFRENAIKSMIGSSGRQRVQVSCFDEYVVPLPPNHILKMFDEIAGKNFEQISTLIEQNEKLAQARDLLLPRLMNGEIAV
jgi:type I restriction enzyme S subunit